MPPERLLTDAPQDSRLFHCIPSLCIASLDASMKRASMYIWAIALSTAWMIVSQSASTLSGAVTTTTFAPLKLVAIGLTSLPALSFAPYVALKRSASSLADAWFSENVRVVIGICC